MSKSWISDDYFAALEKAGRVHDSFCKTLERAQKAREWNGNVEPVKLHYDSGAVSVKLYTGLDDGVPLPGRTKAKFRNVKTDGYASKKEANRAEALRTMQKAGVISGLLEQVEYELIPKQDGERACKYRADFVYRENGDVIVEDAKGVRTADYVIKRKLMLFRHGIRIREV